MWRRPTDDNGSYDDDGYDDGPWRPRWANPNYGNGGDFMDGYGAGYGAGGYTGYTKPKAIGNILVYDAKNEQNIVAALELDEYDEWKYKLMVEHWGKPDDDGNFRIPSTAVTEYRTGHLSFNPCTFDATKKYLSKLLGVGLDSEDEDWLRYHQFALAEGISDRKLPTALHQLTEVYGIGVSRIRYRKGLYLLDDEEQIRWMGLLGCNPMAVANHATTNAEAAEILQMPLDQIDRDFRVDFHDEPLRPSVVGEKGGSGIGQAGNFYSPGHARFLGPRATGYADWTISLQFARLEHIEYLLPVVLPEYTPRSPEKTFLWMDLLRPNGKRIDHRDGWWDREEEKKKKKNGDSNNSHVKAKGSGNTEAFLNGTKRLHRVSAKMTQQIKCISCKAWFHHTYIENCVDVCQSCWEKAWQGVRCPYKDKCGLLMSGHNAPLFLGIDSNEIPIIRCSSCFGRIAPPMNDEDLYLIFSSPTCQRVHDAEKGAGKGKEANLDPNEEILS